jgi:hypothetical protein
MAIAGVTGVASVGAIAGIAIAHPASERTGLQAGAPDGGTVTSGATSGATSNAASGPSEKARLAAWTVTKQPDGTVIVLIRQFRDTVGLQARLRAAGIPASASVSVTGNLACTRYPASATHGATALQLAAGKVEAVAKFVLRSSKLPSGAGIEIVVAQRAIAAQLVRVSPQCTGSQAVPAGR